jgi:GxxExxY protein
MANYCESKIKNKDLLYPKLSYKIQGCIFNVSNKYGRGLKEMIYQKALAEELESAGISFQEQPRINIYSLDTGKKLGTYVPDLIAENKIIIELKATDFTTRNDSEQQRSYLKASVYEVAYLINFGTVKLDIKRSVYSNKRKPYITKLQANACERGANKR